jgi:glucosamine-6-phosphate deaminase
LAISFYAACQTIQTSEAVNLLREPQASSLYLSMRVYSPGFQIAVSLFLRLKSSTRLSRPPYRASFVVKERTQGCREKINAGKGAMESTTGGVTLFTAGTMKLKIYPSKRAAGEAAALAVAEELRRLGQLREQIGVIFATGAAQFDTLEFLTSTPGLPWKKVRGFHLDEYVGLDENHPASFRRFLRERLTQHVDMGAFFEIDGNAQDLDAVCREYIKQLHVAEPQLCLLGIGENGHLAFNEPAEADFHDPLEMKTVTLDSMCRQQQAAEGWFLSWQEAPERALTLTIPTVFRVPKLIASVPGPRKAQVIRRTVHDPISTACPSTLLRTHPDVTVYLDTDSAALLENVPSNTGMHRT